MLMMPNIRLRASSGREGAVARPPAPESGAAPGLKHYLTFVRSTCPYIKYIANPVSHLQHCNIIYLGVKLVHGHWGAQTGY